MAPKGRSKLPLYIQKIPNRSGYYFQRAVPKDIQSKLKLQVWKWKLGDTLSEALYERDKLKLKTDALVADARGQITPELLEWLGQGTTSGLQEALREQQLEPEDIFTNHTIADAYSITDRLLRIERGESVVEHDIEGLLDLCIRLKQPAPSTVIEWRRHLTQLMTLVKKKDPTTITKDDARKYRDHLLSTVQPITLKTRIRSIRGMYNVILTEEWITTNPFECINLRLIKGTTKKKQVVSLDAADQMVRDGKLPKDQTLLYWLLRYTGCHVGEGSGILYQDIDLENGLIHIRPNKLRTIKNDYRERTLPIIEPLAEALKELDINGKKGSDHVFIDMYDSKTRRWGNSMSWHTKIFVSPKACRDSVATTLRQADINERTIGAILGHTPENSTGVYGSVSIETLRNALNQLHQPCNYQHNR